MELQRRGRGSGGAGAAPAGLVWRRAHGVPLVVLTGEHTLCGNFNNNVLKKASTGIEELK